jgi:acetylornithine/succinyldiaminopimelate/putrescine aminotransferase
MREILEKLLKSLEDKCAAIRAHLEADAHQEAMKIVQTIGDHAEELNAEIVKAESSFAGKTVAGVTAAAPAANAAASADTSTAGTSTTA